VRVRVRVRVRVCVRVRVRAMRYVEVGTIWVCARERKCVCACV